MVQNRGHLALLAFALVLLLHPAPASLQDGGNVPGRWAISRPRQAALATVEALEGRAVGRLASQPGTEKGGIKIGKVLVGVSDDRVRGYARHGCHMVEGAVGKWEVARTLRNTAGGVRTTIPF